MWDSLHCSIPRAGNSATSHATRWVHALRYSEEMSKKRRVSRPSAPAAPEYRAESIAGTIDFAARELERCGALAVRTSDTWATFQTRNIAALLPQLRTVHAVYAAASFAVPRPKALLGNEHFRRITPLLQAALRTDAFTGLRIEAAGKDSPVMGRLGEALARAAGVPFAPETGDLVVRVVRTRNGWDVLTRLTARPSSARSWRVCNIPGGLHAPLAVVLNDIAGATRETRYLNVMAGSGTIAIEHALRGGEALAVEISADAVRCAQDNIAAAGVAHRVRMLNADMFQAAPELTPGTFDVVTVNPPWGDAVGRHATNQELHERLLLRVHELLVPGGALVLVTHEIRLLKQLLHAYQDRFELHFERQVGHGGHHPVVAKLIAR